MSPIDLKVSEATRLRRLAKDAFHKDALRTLVVPIPRGTEPLEFILGFLSELFPEPEAPKVDG
jgi:hypothetical protein